MNLEGQTEDSNFRAWSILRGNPGEERDGRGQLGSEVENESGRIVAPSWTRKLRGKN